MNELLLSSAGSINLPEQYIAVGGINEIGFYTIDGQLIKNVQLNSTGLIKSVQSMVFSEGHLFALCGGCDLYVIDQSLKIVSKKNLGLPGSEISAATSVLFPYYGRYYPILSAGSRLIRASLPGTSNIVISDELSAPVHDLSYNNGDGITSALYVSCGRYIHRLSISLKENFGPLFIDWLPEDSWMTASMASTAGGRLNFLGSNGGRVDYYGYYLTTNFPRGYTLSRGRISTSREGLTALSVSAPNHSFYLRYYENTIEAREYFENKIIKGPNNISLEARGIPKNSVKYSQSADKSILCVVSNEDDMVSVIDTIYVREISAFRVGKSISSIAFNDGVIR